MKSNLHVPPCHVLKLQLSFHKKQKSKTGLMPGRKSHQEQSYLVGTRKKCWELKNKGESRTGRKGETGENN